MRIQSIPYVSVFMANAMLFTGCGSDSTEVQPTVSSTKPANLTIEPTDAPPPEPSGDTTSIEGPCALLPPVEIDAAFSNKFTLRIAVWDDYYCQYEISYSDGLFDGTFVLQLTKRALYDIYKAQRESSSRFNVRYLEGLGQEAVIFNNGQAQVLLNDDGGFLLTQTILAMGESTITPEESSAAMEQLARAVAERL